MIQGIGTDIIEIARVRRTIRIFGNRFFKKMFTEQEIEYCNSSKDAAVRFAGRFAAKEAVVKALGKGLRGMRWQDIEVVRDGYGKPSVVLHDAALELAENQKVTALFLSISHSKEYAVAQVITWREMNNDADRVSESDQGN